MNTALAATALLMGLAGAPHCAAMCGAAFAGIDGLLLIVTLSAVLVILVLVYRALVLPFVVLFTSISALALGLITRMREEATGSTGAVP